MTNMSSHHSNVRENAPIGAWFQSADSKDKAFKKWIEQWDGESLHELYTKCTTKRWLSPRQCSKHSLMLALVSKHWMTLALLHPTPYCKIMVRDALRRLETLRRTNGREGRVMTPGDRMPVVQCSMDVLCRRALEQDALAQLLVNHVHGHHDAMCSEHLQHVEMEPDWDKVTIVDDEWLVVKELLHWQARVWTPRTDHSAIMEVVNMVFLS